MRKSSKLVTFVFDSENTIMCKQTSHLIKFNYLHINLHQIGIERRMWVNEYKFKKWFQTTIVEIRKFQIAINVKHFFVYFSANPKG